MAAGKWIWARLERAIDALIDQMTPLAWTAAAGVVATVSVEVAVAGVLTGAVGLFLASRRPPSLQSS